MNLESEHASHSSTSSTNFNMTTHKQIVSIGVVPPEHVRTALESSAARAKGDLNCDVELFYFDANNFSCELESITEKLRSKEWHGVIIGGGVRLNDKMTDIFEKVVNAARETVPAARMGFNSSGDDLYECVKRNYAVKKE